MKVSGVNIGLETGVIGLENRSLKIKRLRERTQTWGQSVESVCEKRFEKYETPINGSSHRKNK